MSSSDQYIIDILKQKFEHEVARRNVFDNVLGLPIALLSFIIPGIYFMLQDVTTNYSQVLMMFLVVYAITLIISTIWTIHLLHKFYFSSETEYMSLPSSDVIMDVYDISKDREEVIANFEREQKNDANIVADLDKFLIKSYKECTAINAKINDRRETLFFEAKKSLGLTFAFAVVFFLVIVILKLIGCPIHL